MNAVNILLSPSRWPNWLNWALVNGLFLALNPLWPAMAGALPLPLRSLAINLVLFIAPAVGWHLALGPSSRVLGARLIRALVLSLAALLVVLVAVRLSGLSLNQVLAWNTMWVVTNLGFVVARFRKGHESRRSLTRNEVATAVVVFAMAYGLYYYGATRVVPAQVDHDLEVQATGYGLLTRFEPLLLTDRRTIYYFAHPPLLHTIVAASFLHYGTLPSLKFFDDASRRARDSREGRPFALPGHPVRLKEETEARRVTEVDPPDYVLSGAGGDDGAREKIERIELVSIYDRYRAEPHTLETRTPNIFFGAMTVALLALWAGRLGHRPWLAVLAALAYATHVEVFVRASYGGYFAMGTFTCLLMLLAADRWRRTRHGSGRTAAMAGGVISALADHKMVLLPIAMVISTAWGSMRKGLALKQFGVLAHPVVVGFTIGIAIYWVYGFAVAPAAFLQDHFHHHLVDRLTHVNPLGYHNYPARVALWWEFARNTSWLLIPAGLIGLVYDLIRSNRSTGDRSMRRLWLVWVLLTAVAFTVIDWRMTKHLVPMILPLYLGLMPRRHSGTGRVMLTAVVLVLILGWNVWDLSRVVADFQAFTVTPAW